ncbi:3-hydroxyisobutyrate dehydrogenase [Culex quinquefasciatus]|uniref:3-hydroxyisobutyrate dehydrogenase n=1 Tax=Culex quinquefasciatus TaxID=7176 RepID=B0XIX1_CULQU|nr:3-hydroxyisobutyrate dehydrogenase [Culex quinquefasciatus]|eukprot:XP_001869593.1 3-hydroxyisobutyrate dehydrogenase [Culex quinquefasciatus]
MSSSGARGGKRQKLDGEEDENNMTTPSALETAETKMTTPSTATKKSAANKNVASTPKARAISNKTKAAIAAIEDITSSPSPKRKRKLNNSGDVLTLDLNTFSSVRRNVPVSHLLNRPARLATFSTRATRWCGTASSATNSRRRAPIKMTDMTLACLSDPQVAKDARHFFNWCSATVALCLLTSSARSTSSDRRRPGNIAGHRLQDCLQRKLVPGSIISFFTAKTQIQCSKNQAEEGMLIILAAGDVSNASKMNLVLQMIDGVTLWPASDCKFRTNVTRDFPGSARISVHPSKAGSGNGAFEFGIHVIQKYFAEQKQTFPYSCLRWPQKAFRPSSSKRNKCEEKANSERLFPDYIKNFKLKFTIYPSPEVSPEESQSDRAPNAFIATI